MKCLELLQVQLLKRMRRKFVNGGAVTQSLHAVCEISEVKVGMT